MPLSEQQTTRAPVDSAKRRSGPRDLGRDRAPDVAPAGTAPAWGPFDPGEPAAPAILAILEDLLETRRPHERAFHLQDAPEPLHGVRVATRRARSLLGELKRTLPRRAGKGLRRELSRIARATGPGRDLDVFTLTLPSYEASLPRDVAAALDPLRERLAEERRTEREQLVGELSPARSGRLDDALRALRDAVTAEAATEEARRPLGEVAGERISKARQRVIDLARELDPSSPDARLHRLRIACKKLRYLTEFFQSLLDGEEAARGIAELKGVQDALGDLNDLSFQRDMLRRLERDGEAGAALRRLDEHLAGLQSERRAALAPLLETLASAD